MLVIFTTRRPDAFLQAKQLTDEISDAQREHREMCQVVIRESTVAGRGNAVDDDDARLRERWEDAASEIPGRLT